MKNIMFNEQFGLQQATFDRLKTMTRRTVPDKTMKDALAYQSHHIDDEKAYEKYILDHAPYKVGEIVAVAQRYSQIISAITPRFAPHAKDWMRSEKGWNNKMFVKAEYMPHHIKITGLKVEGLAGISDEDCLKEGIQVLEGGFRNQDAYTFKGDKVWWKTPYLAYKELIDRLNRRGFFESNPLVYAYTYELVY